MKHLTRVEKYPGTLEELARDIANLRYDSFAKLLEDISDDLLVDAALDKIRKSVKDKEKTRVQLAAGLESIAEDIYKIKDKMVSLWTSLCKPYMKNN